MGKDIPIFTEDEADIPPPSKNQIHIHKII